LELFDAFFVASVSPCFSATSFMISSDLSFSLHDIVSLMLPRTVFIQSQKSGCF
jgi:hypothetical protein